MGKPTREQSLQSAQQLEHALGDLVGLGLGVTSSASPNATRFAGLALGPQTAMPSQAMQLLRRS